MSLTLHPIKKNIKELMAISEWRNKALISLRSIKPTLVDFNKQCEWIDSLKAKSDSYFFLYDNLTFIGYTGLDKINETNKTAELSLLIGQSYQKQGYGKEAVFQILKYGFTYLSLNCVFIEVYLTTNNWINFWASLGFKKEGVLRARKFWDGLFYDSIIASILKNEFYKFYKDKLNI